MKEFESFSSYLAKRSGEIIRPYFRTPVPVETKADDSPVTLADRKAEEAMRELIMKEFPEHGILGEEFGAHQPEARYQWVLDPIDGTLNFICGGLMFATLIALLKDGKPILGAIHQPILNELLIGDNVETRLNGAQVRVRDCRQLSDARLLTTDPFLIKKHQDFAVFEELRRRVKICRSWGDGYGYLLLAAGCVDVMIDPVMHPWDIMALVPTVRGAGGTITDYHGGNPVKGTSILATAGTIHREVVEILNSKGG
jgi:myo-inositol-1(or 4)-monophosphatase